jgi:TolB-like protein/Tfp pilus assembly protein PilF
VALLALVAVFWPSQRSAHELVAGTALPAEPSLAVLPLSNRSPETENEYFADGLSEALVSKLAGIKGLKVASLTASFRFKGKYESPAAIGKELQVNHLLEGSVRRSGNRVLINARLIDARDGYHRWSETFDRELTDIIEIQEEIALAVANALQVKLVAADTQRLRSPGTRDPEAYGSYLKARGIFSRLDGKGDLKEMKRLYQEAIKRDDKFAAAHAGLAHYYFNNEGEEGKHLGRQHAEKAIALDPESSEAVSARACFELLRYQQQGYFSAYERAKSDFHRSLELDPSNSQALFHYGRALFWPEPAEALEIFERNIKVDPRRFGAVGFSADLMSRLGRRETARERVMALYEQNPEQRSSIAIHVATLEYFEGHLDRAIAFMERGRGSGSLGGSAMNRWPLYMSLGDREAANKLLAFTPDDPLAAAARLATEGRYADAFASLDRRLEDFPITRLLDVPAARLALIAAKPARALEILEGRFPDLAKGIEPVNAYNILPALDLAVAWAATGEETKRRTLLDRAAEFLEGPDASHWPMFIFLRARALALAGERELALQTLDRAFGAGFRMTWGVDLFYQYFGYIDPVEADPAFAKLRGDPGFKRWLERIKSDNASRLTQLRASDAQEQSAARVAQ